MNQTIGGLSICGLGLCWITVANAQPQFSGVKATEEGAIRLEWQSETNALYQIQYSSELSDTITWNTLLDDYPSHGTNTFWLDTGEYYEVPAVNHPKYDFTRFYRAVYVGTNLVTPPTVSIEAPTNSAILSGQVTVTVATASSTLPIIDATLWVDGQAVDSSDDGTNFLINTCEWPNGEHVLFATAKGQSRLSGPSGSYPIDVAQSVSAYVAVTFENLITKVAFSEPFFEPALGQTQHVTAAFAANVDWTLQIIDDSSNAVRTVTGSGAALQYGWDGTGDGGTNLPDGAYSYAISAQINGQALLSGGDGPSLLLDDFAMLDSAPEDWYPTSMEEALMAGWTSYVPPSPPFPPVEINGEWFAWEEVYGPQPLIEVQIPLETQEEFLAQLQGVEPLDSGSGIAAAYAGPSGQSTTAPTRPPTAPVKGKGGTFGVAFFNFPQGATCNRPYNGLPGFPTPPRVQIEGSAANLHFDIIPEVVTTAKRFAARMTKKGWKLSFNKSGVKGNLTIADLRKSSLGGNEIFGQVELGLFMDHGSYGTSLDYHTDANQSFQTYFASDNTADASAPWIRMSEFGFGGSLRWMGFLACNNLRDQNYTSMLNQGALPISSNLHLLCGTSSLSYMSEDFAKLWAKFMQGGFLVPKRTVPDAWFDAGTKAYEPATNITGNVTFRVAGHDNCFNDKLTSYAGSTSGTITYVEQQVYP